MAGLFVCRKGRSAQRRAAVREERAMSVVGGRSDCSVIPSAAQSWSVQLIFCKCMDWSLFPNLKMVFHWHVYWVLAMPAGKSQAGYFFLPKPQFIYLPARECCHRRQ